MDKSKMEVEIDSDIKLDARPELHRCVFDETSCKVKTTGSQMSSKISSLAWCNALAILPGKSEKKDKLIKGDKVEIIKF